MMPLAAKLEIDRAAQGHEAIELPFTEIIESDGRSPIQGGGSVEFRLLYQGRLPANGDVADKFAIRRQFHPQLRSLCYQQPMLRSQLIAWGHVEARQIYGESFSGEQAFALGIKRLADTHLNGFSFMPLARQEWHLRCSIDVLFLRREKPGRVFMKGDIDNRLKTLFDALQMPHLGQDIGDQVPSPDEVPYHVLLEDDELIADVSVTTDRLLSFPEEHEHTSDYAVLVIDVKLQPTQRSGWSHVFD
jgi:hypothetical protein